MVFKKLIFVFHFTYKIGPMNSYIGSYRKIFTITTTVLLLFDQLVFAQSTNNEAASQARKTFSVVRTSEAPKIDGYGDDTAWLNAQPVTDFIMYSPFNGNEPNFKTEVKVLYDDNALFICAKMYDPNPDSIFVELGKRDADNSLNADYFKVQISSFNDGINGEVFKVSASNVQSDSKERDNSGSFDNEDGEWDAVWDSKTRVTDSGWICEMKIPFSALRFSTKKDQVWGINFWREVRRRREQSTWNYVNRKRGSSINHLGQMTGLNDVEPPLRLSLTPYLSGYVEKASDDNSYATTYNGGMDLKVGLNESFTLDATLVPDFGQVQSDDYILNLTPYETQYNENRSFFTEGTELFSRGNIFYSRRIGGSPHLAGSVSDMTGTNEIVTENPSEVSLINATKISGRSQKGLGVGLFNGITNTTYVHLRDTVTGDERRVITEPLTNYNMVVFDQSLKNNSFVSLANTNVLRAAEKDANFYTADVTSLQSLLQTKSKLYSISGTASLSQKYFNDRDTDIGKSYNVSAGKTGGTFRAEYAMSLISDNYDPNDMGYLSKNNEMEQNITFSYNTFEPFGSFMNTKSWISYENERLYQPSAFTEESLSVGTFVLLMNYWSLRIEAEYLPRGENDYFEPRTSDFSRYYHRPRALGVGAGFDTDMSKRLYFNGSMAFINKWADFSQHDIEVAAMPVFKFTNHFSLYYEFYFSHEKNDIGYVETYADNNIVFGKRDVRTFENTISGSYAFTSLSSLTLRCRHYWSRADYDGTYYLLNDNGSLNNSAYSGTNDVNTNFLNIDMVYSWRFAPGSELSVVWKNAIAGYSSEIINNAFENFDDMLELTNMNSISLKILYYLDYQNLKRALSRK